MQSLDYQSNPDFTCCISAARKTKKYLCVNNLRFPVRTKNKKREVDNLSKCRLWINTEELLKRIQTFPVPVKISKYLSKISD